MAEMTIRVAKTSPKTLSHTFYVDEEPTDSSTTVTVLVTDATGTTASSGSATSAGSGVYTYLLPAQSTLKLLTVTWSATISGSAVTEVDTVEVVGGFLFGLAAGRASDASLTDSNKYPTADLIAARQEVEEECERICDRAFVPRYRRVTLDGTGTTDLVLPDGGDEQVAGILLSGVRTIRSARVAPRVGEAFVALSASELAALAVTSDGILRRTDGAIWTEGIDNIIVEYEYGSDAPPADLKRAAMIRFRARLNLTRSGIPDRATSFTAADGGTYRIDLPDAFKTGMPEVDAAYSRYSKRSRAGAGGRQVPASRQLNFDPQRYSLFHGGVR